MVATLSHPVYVNFTLLDKLLQRFLTLTDARHIHIKSNQS